MEKEQLLKLPPEGYDGIAVLLDLGDERLDLLIGELSAQGLTLDLGAVAKRLAVSLRRLELEMESLLWAIAGLNQLCRQRGYSANEFIAVLNDSIEAHAPDEWREKHISSWKKSFQRLAPLFEPDRFGAMASKALRLLNSRALALEDFQVLTELKPVFDSATVKVEALILSNTLVIEYSDLQGQLKTISLRIGAGDLDTISRESTQARRKNEAMREQAEQWRIDLLEEDQGQ